MVYVYRVYDTYAAIAKRGLTYEQSATYTYRQYNYIFVAMESMSASNTLRVLYDFVFGIERLSLIELFECA